MSRLVEKAMLIDDSDIDLFIQRRFLEVYDFSDTLVLYKSAQDALNVLQTSKEAAPDVIFLDLNMPEVDGFTFLQRFKDLPTAIQKKTRIVVLTSSNSNQDRALAFTHPNVIQFITKPLKQTDIEELRNMFTAIKK
jgi:two-component system, NarL family, nitrate/nitrite response regulator NarL